MSLLGWVDLHNAGASEQQADGVYCYNCEAKITPQNPSIDINSCLHCAPKPRFELVEYRVEQCPQCKGTVEVDDRDVLCEYCDGFGVRIGSITLRNRETGEVVVR